LRHRPIGLTETKARAFPCPDGETAAVRVPFRTVRAADRPLRMLASRLLWKSRLARPLRLKTRHPDGFRMWFHSTGMSATLWGDPNAYPEDLEFLRSYLRAGDVVVDVGANIGLLTVAAATYVGPRGRVLAFEPHPRTAGFLRENVRLNGFEHVETYPYAVGAANGTVLLTDARYDDQNFVTESDGVEVPVVALDDVVPRDLDVALLKIDVEGYERFVLAGAADVARRTSCVYFEAGDALSLRFGYRAADLLRDVAELGFELSWIDAGGRHEVTDPERAAPTDEPRNFIGIRPGR
jgi:FkbM family methyltransferase